MNNRLKKKLLARKIKKALDEKTLISNKDVSDISKDKKLDQDIKKKEENLEKLNFEYLAKTQNINIYKTDKITSIWCCKKGFLKYMKEFSNEKQPIYKILFEHQMPSKYFVKFESLSKDLTELCNCISTGSSILLRDYSDKIKRDKLNHAGLILEERQTHENGCCPSKFCSSGLIKDFIACDKRICNLPQLLIYPKIVCTYAYCINCTNKLCIGYSDCANTDKMFEMCLDNITNYHRKGGISVSLLMKTIIKVGAHNKVPEFIMDINMHKLLEKHFSTMQHTINIDGAKPLSDTDIKFMKIGTENVIMASSLKKINIFVEACVVLTTYYNEKKCKKIEKQIMHPFFISDVSETDLMYILRFNTFDPITYIGREGLAAWSLNICSVKLADVGIQCEALQKFVNVKGLVRSPKEQSLATCEWYYKINYTNKVKIISTVTFNDTAIKNTSVVTGIVVLVYKKGYKKQELIVKNNQIDYLENYRTEIMSLIYKQWKLQDYSILKTIVKYL